MTRTRLAKHNASFDICTLTRHDLSVEPKLPPPDGSMLQGTTSEDLDVQLFHGGTSWVTSRKADDRKVQAPAQE